MLPIPFWTVLQQSIGESPVSYLVIVITVMLLFWMYRENSRVLLKRREHSLASLEQRLKSYGLLESTISLYLQSQTENYKKNLYDIIGLSNPHLDSSLYNQLINFMDEPDYIKLQNILWYLRSEIFKQRKKLDDLLLDDIELDGFGGKFFYYASFAEKLLQPLVVTIVIFISLFLGLFWIYIASSVQGSLNKIDIFIFGLSMFIWLLTLIVTINLKMKNILITSSRKINILLWLILLSPFYWIGTIYAHIGIIIFVFQMYFALKILPRLRKTQDRFNLFS